MTKNDNFKEYGMPVVVLVAICFVTTLLLALTNSVSEPIIIRNQAITATANRKELLPDADDFTQLEIDSYASSTDGKASGIGNSISGSGASGSKSLISMGICCDGVKS